MEREAELQHIRETQAIETENISKRFIIPFNKKASFRTVFKTTTIGYE